MKRLFLAVAGVALLGISTGCCCWPNYGSYWGGGYGGYGGCGTGCGTGCGAGGCAVPGGTVPPGQPVIPPTSYYPGSSVGGQQAQIGTPVPVPQPINGPVTYGGAPFQTAAVPLESLPTY